MFAQVNEAGAGESGEAEAPAGGGVVPDETSKNFWNSLRQKLDDLGHDHHQLAEAINRLEKACKRG